MCPFPRLDIHDHARDSAGYRYVYPVLSRRAGGVSLGINLNTNNACNWRCIYCQVPGLVRGAPEPVDLVLLDVELRHALATLVPEARTRFRDVAFSGNGEPTSAPEFPQAVGQVVRALHDAGLAGTPVRLITNGSQMHRRAVLDAVGQMADPAGEVWFKLDAVTPAGTARINGVRANPQAVLRRLRQCAQRCPTWVQTCLFALDGTPPGDVELQSWLEVLAHAAPDLAGVHVYGLARPSMQAEAPRLSRLPAGFLEALAERVRQLGLRAVVSP